MNINYTHKAAIAFVVLCIAFAVFCGLRAYASQEVGVPSDEMLMAIFKSHRADFFRLRQMAVEDMHETSFFSESNISNRLPESRINEYKILLRLSPGLQVGASHDGSVRFVFYSSSQAIGAGVAKGIQFIPDVRKLIGSRADTLDGVGALPAGVYLREMESKWFIFYQRDE